MMRLALLAAGIAAMACQGAEASVSDRVAFKVAGTVIVWGDHGIAREFVVEPGETQAGANVSLDAHVVQTGDLVSLDAPSSAPLRHTGTSFYVASNTAFNIDAEAQGRMDAAAEQARVDLSITSLGPAAQTPHANGLTGGIDRSVTRLVDLKTRRTIYRGNRRTAAKRGSIADQSARFDLSLNTVTKQKSALPPIAVTVYIP